MAQVPLKELLKSPTVKSTAIGLGVAVLVPVAVTYLAPLVRPVARSTLKAGLVTIEKGREIAAEFGEIFDDLVAEVREELRAERETAEQRLDDARSGLPG
jgi:hypothetical protein